MQLLKLFNFNKKCTHEKIPPNLEKAYCPDCGKLIKNEWYITRCACCGVKLRAKSRNGEITSLEHYCTNCGSQEVIVEQLDQINFININYAVLVKKEVENILENKYTTQCWQEKTNEQPKLLTQYR
ncbi:MAG: hypothetical protein E7Z92_05000 [Cyanobacteria bacterium SIG31]|nr:hypothetical protein [Cyanobacteria bacterium SIG31]